MSRRCFLMLLAALFILSGQALAADVQVSQTITQVNEAIYNANANWQAGGSFIAEMPMDEFVSLLGADLTAPNEMDLWTPNSTIELPDRFDWRSIEGQYNFVTPVKYQGRCGSCVAFGCIAGIESGIRVREQDPNLEVDLSEQHAFNCTFFSGCNMGSNASSLLSTVKSQGVVDEDCFPYMSGGTGFDYGCNDACAGAASRAFKIAGYSSIWGGVDAIKQAMLQFGPLPATFYVYEDFKYYVSGVYEHVFGPMLGGHQILLIGWENDNECWIVKNSWSESFGEDGFFRIKWNSAGISSDVTKLNIGDQPFQPGALPGGNCPAVANHIYNQCSLAYELENETLSGEEFLDYCNGGDIPQCVHSCHEQHAECNRLAGCIGFCTEQWCAMDFEYLYETCGLAVALEPGNPMSKVDAIELCEDVGYNSSAMKCILECIPQTNSCATLANCMQDCPLCAFPAVDFAADATYSETAPLTVTFTRDVSYPTGCDPTITHWDFGDGATSYDPSDVVVHTYQEEGVYSVKLQVSNAAGPGIELKPDFIIVGEMPVDDDTVDDDVADDDIADDDLADDDFVDDDLGDDDLADDDLSDDDLGDDDLGDDDLGDDDDDDSGGCGC